MTLRPYQLEAVEAVYRHLETKDTNPCVVIPTAGGKSLVLARIASDAVSLWGGRVLILAHVKELLQQNADKIHRLCPSVPVGVYSAGLSSRDTAEPVIVAGIQSVYQRAAELGSFDLGIVDEAHLIPEDGDGMYRTFLAASKELCPHQRVIGFTATPYRVKGGVICKPENILNEICYEVGVSRLVGEGYLSRLTSKCGKSTIDLTGLRVRAGEFVQEDVEQAVNTSGAVDSAVRDLVEKTKDRKSVIVFCSSVNHCYAVAEKLRLLVQDRVAIVTGDTPSDERANILAAFKGVTQTNLFGEVEPPVKYLLNMGVLTTGFDAPNIDCVVLLRPTKSCGLYVQMVGRGFRLSPDTGKQNCLVLDYGGNIVRHGPVDCVVVRKQPRAKQGCEPVMAKECPGCGEMLAPAYSVCPVCGHVFSRKEVELAQRATNGGIVSGEPVVEEHEVALVDYSVHEKKDAEPGAPRTVEVTYFEPGMYKHVREWLCVEHDGYPREKFLRWWLTHTNGRTPAPQTAERCVALCRDPSIVRRATAIETTLRPGEKFARVTRYDLAPLEPPAPKPQPGLAPAAPAAGQELEPGSDLDVPPPPADPYEPFDDLPF